MRARTVSAAVVVVAVGIVLGAVLLVVVMERTLVQEIDDSAHARAAEVADLMRQERPPTRLTVHERDDALVQVVDGTGHVMAASVNLEGEPPIARFRPPRGRTEARTIQGLAIEVNSGDAFRVVALTTEGRHGLLTVYVGANLERVRDSVGTVRDLLLVGLPMLLVLVGATSWSVVGRALRPVDSIRREMADITAHDLDRRVPEPRSDDEIGRLARTVNETLDRLESFNLRQQRFVADASHELQSPLASSLADLEVALAHPEATNWQETADGLVEDNRRMTRLVRDLLFLARSGQEPAAAPTVVDLDDVVRAEASRAHGAVPVDVSRVTPVEVRGHADQLARVVRNLLDNATRHARSEVGVELSRNGAGATLIVDDDGPGVPAEARERIFERFARVDDSRSRTTGGAGLGLAIAREIVESHRGTITLEPSPGRTRFVVRLPSAD